MVCCRNCRRFGPELSSSLSESVLFFLFASALLHGCCGFLVALFVSLSRWVLHELSVCDAIYLSRTVNIDSLFLADFLKNLFCVLCFCFFLVFFVFLPTSIPFFFVVV